METEAGDNVVENGGSGGAAEMEVAVAMAAAVWRCGGSGVALWRCGLRGGVAQWHGAVAVGYACSCSSCSSRSALRNWILAGICSRWWQWGGGGGGDGDGGGGGGDGGRGGCA